MGERDTSRLGTLQLAVMRVLWEHGEASVNDVHARLAAERSVAPTTVATLLKRLEKRGYVAHGTRGRQFIYRAVRDAGDVHRSMVSELTHDLFGGDASELMVHLLKEGDIADGDLAHIKRLIEQRERRGG
jgi:predicted transcriptional regulator